MPDPAPHLPPAPPLEADAWPPPARILANGRHRVLISSAGTGGSWHGGLALTLWRADPVEDADGFFVYLRDRDGGEIWSAGRRPLPDGAERVGASWRPGTMILERRQSGIETRLEICVPPDADCELRRLTVTNRSGRPRSLEVGTCVEVVLGDPAAHAAHPVFAKLFLETEHDARRRALLVRRRPRAAGEHHPWLAHALVDDSAGGELEFETDRARLVGRRPAGGAPRALATDAPLPGATGAVIDPALCLRRRLELPAGGRARLTFLLGAAPERDGALALADRFGGEAAVAAAFDAAQAAAWAELAALALSEDEADLWQALGAAMLCGDPALRAAPEVIARARGEPAAALAALGLSPRRAYAVLHADRPGGAALRAAMTRAHAYWRRLGLPLDLAIVIDEPDGGAESGAGGPLQLRASDLAPDARDLLDASARLVVVDRLPVPGGAAAAPSALPPRGPAPAAAAAGPPAAAPEALRFDNGHGGFNEAGDEYVIRLRPRPDGGLDVPPQPWINVIANERFGFLLSETGAGCTWCGNSREHRLTPWSNDPLRDPHGEALYLRDEDDGAMWSPLPGPIPGGEAYEMRHGFGYSLCLHESAGLALETLLFAAPCDPVRCTVVRLTNRGSRPRALALYAYWRLVLGDAPDQSGRLVVTRGGGAPGTLLARNAGGGEFAGGAAFAAVIAPPEAGAVSATCDRAAFLGPGGAPERPAAVARGGDLDGRAGAGLDPCFAQRAPLILAPGATAEVVFLLGEESGDEAAETLIARLRRPAAVARAFVQAREGWRDLLGGVRIATPAPELDLMVNGWLPYQTLACRLWARSAFYQSGGAFGYRDQLQDAAALLPLRPELARAQIVLHAGHQFTEGDVLHWWHPPGGRGLRTRFADDLLWLPLVAAEYVAATGDAGLLDEPAPLLQARALAPGEDEALLAPRPAGRSVSVYEHCCLALDRGLTAGAHGLPLFGGGDWNDGMNRVGREGRGESVWMGFFLHAVLDAFAPLCERRGDAERAARYRAWRERYRAALHEHAWDGGWYRRGWYDGGAALGSAAGDECRIDALAQAWAVISGAAPADRAAAALDAVERELISAPDRLIRLLAPPFDRTPHDPGYIKGYVPGVRENGGQYTHAALWVVKAMAHAGRRDRAAALLAMINPVNHARTPEQVARYRVEPYVVCADVYGAAPHVGRGGWTWYTGSSGWMFRVTLEDLLGLRIEEGARLRVRPRVPDDWPGFAVDYRLPGETTLYALRAANPGGRAARVVAAFLDGEPLLIEGGAAVVPLRRDGGRHEVTLTLGA